MEKLRNKYKFGKVEQTEFVYTGIHIQQNEEKEIFVQQNDFVDNLIENEFSGEDHDQLLEKNDNRMVRKTQGQLSWLAT